MEQFPIALIPGGEYFSININASPEDVFLFVTDGVTEVEDSVGQEFGSERLSELLLKHAGQPLDRIWNAIMTQVAQHGPQIDDQSLLLLRVLNP